MPLQKQVHFFRQLSANAFSSRDLVNACPAEPIHGPEPLKQQTFPILTHARAIVENAFFDSLFHQQLVVRVGEPMCFVSNALEQSQRRGIHWKSQRQRAARSINLFVFFGQTDDGKVVQSQSLQFAAGGRELAFSSIDNDQVG